MTIEPTVNHAFRIQERKYKQRKNTPDYSDVIDFKRIVENNDEIILDQLGIEEVLIDSPEHIKWPYGFRLKKGSIKAFKITQIPGLLYVPNPWEYDHTHRRLAYLSLARYACYPNLTNLNAHWKLPKDMSLWELMNLYQGTAKEELISKADDSITKPASELIRKLRWATLGWQYCWTTKSYIKDTQYPIDSELSELSNKLIHVLSNHLEELDEAFGAGADMEGDDPEKYLKRRNNRDDILDISNLNYDPKRSKVSKGYHKPFFAEAGICNFYQPRDALTSHVDRSEVNMQAPLISLSVGNSCVFLIGGATRHIKPVSICIRSGDILVMSGQSRRSFHGVPRIIESSLPDEIFSREYDDLDPELDWKLFTRTEWDNLKEFMSSTRININLRQVNHN